MTPNNDHDSQRLSRIEQAHACIAGRTALVVVDMQRGFLDPGAALEVPTGREIVPRLARLIAACRGRGAPVVFTEFVYRESVPCQRGEPFGVEHLPAEPGQPTGLGRPSNNCLVGPGEPEGPDSARTVSELAPRESELVVQGHTYDKFYGTPLDLALRCQDIRQLIVTGVTTDICVNATVMSAAARDYRVTVVTDGVATVFPHRQEVCFEIWRHKFARLKTTDEILHEIEGM